MKDLKIPSVLVPLHSLCYRSLHELYDDGAYVKIRGLVYKINVKAKYLTIVRTDISFDDIQELRF